MSSLVRAIGRRTINSVNHMLDLFAFTGRISDLLLRRHQTGRKLVLKFTSEQIYYTAIQALPINEGLLVPVLQNKGVLLTKRGSYEDAEKVLDRCLHQSRSLDPMGMASLHFAYGNLMLKTGRSTDAIGSFEKALSVDR
jgi:tetratricopeptide (TPR) repeat protein